jgi:aryl-alcohol dehydrogenase-like predicted oxidoreductase
MSEIKQAQPVTMTSGARMEFVSVAGTSLKLSRVALGTWAIGGWMWGGTDEHQAIATIRAAIEQGINLIDTAPAYGFGRSEELVGRALNEASLRQRVKIATKVGLAWRDGKVFRNASPERIFQEIEASLRRLRTDYIDIYQVHWPDPLVPIESTAEAMRSLFEQKKIRAVGGGFAAWRPCTLCSLRLICLNARSKLSHSLTVLKPD